MPESFAIGFPMAIPESFAIGFSIPMPDFFAAGFFAPIADSFAMGFVMADPEPLAIAPFGFIASCFLDESGIIAECWLSAAAFAGVLAIACACSGAAAAQIRLQRTAIERKRFIVRNPL